jgi:hypothetical protein
MSLTGGRSNLPNVEKTAIGLVDRGSAAMASPMGCPKTASFQAFPTQAFPTLPPGWYGRGRISRAFYGAFRPLLWRGGRWPTGIPFAHADRPLASRTKQVRLASRTKGCAPNASTVECSGEVRYPEYDFLFLSTRFPRNRDASSQLVAPDIS